MILFGSIFGCINIHISVLRSCVVINLMLNFLCFKSHFLPCSIEFDRDDELFATAGVSRRIKIFEFSSVSACCFKFDSTNCIFGHFRYDYFGVTI